MLRYLKDELPKVFGSARNSPARCPRRTLLDGSWDGGPSFAGLTDPEDGFHLRWNIADLGQSRRQELIEAVDATVGTGAVEQVTTMYAWFPDTGEYKHMTQVRVRLNVAANMSAAFCGTSCITVGSQ
eukprot:9026910-Pyramimonas_sp.AAC.1